MIFSVIIPTLREEKRVGALLRSLQHQDFAGEFEILVCDGGSEDQTRAVVERFSGVQFLECPRGVSRQRNAGARAARGQLLVFLDADDIAPSRFLSGIWRAYKHLPFSVACPWFFAYDGVFSTKVFYWLFNIGFWLGQSTLRMGSGVCIIARRADFIESGGFDEKLHLGEDIKIIRSLSPRFGLHRHLMSVRLGTSGRRFGYRGGWRLMAFYARITPLLVMGHWNALQKIEYRAAPYDNERTSN